MLEMAFFEPPETVIPKAHSLSNHFLGCHAPSLIRALPEITRPMLVESTVCGEKLSTSRALITLSCKVQFFSPFLQ